MLHASRSASYPGTAIASSYDHDVGSIDFSRSPGPAHSKSGFRSFCKLSDSESDRVRVEPGFFFGLALRLMVLDFGRVIDGIINLRLT